MTAGSPARTQFAAFTTLLSQLVTMGLFSLKVFTLVSHLFGLLDIAKGTLDTHSSNAYRCGILDDSLCLELFGVDLGQMAVPNSLLSYFTLFQTFKNLVGSVDGGDTSKT